MTIPNRDDDQKYSLEDARELGVSLTSLRVSCSAHRWQGLLIPFGKIQWEKMGRHDPDDE